MNLKDTQNTSNNSYPHSDVLVGSDQFVKVLEERARCASDRFFVQTMTFEGDDAGRKLIDILIASPAKEKLLVIDCYSDVVINDRLIHLPPGLFDKNIQKEFWQTKELLKIAYENGIQIARTNPIGAFYRRYPHRNHKKSIVIDNAVFLGGINFSDHNFEWHDMMICSESSSLSSIVALDIIKNSKGETTSGILSADDTTVALLNRNSGAEYAEVFSWLKHAKSSITVFSPYISEPFLSILNSISDKIKIKIVVPEVNNKGLFTDYLKRESHAGWFHYFETPGKMSHLKAILIDEKELIFGSSNFDFISYLFEEEILVKTTSEQIIKQFRQVIHDPVMSQSKQLLAPSYNIVTSYIPIILWKVLRVSDPKSKQLYES